MREGSPPRGAPTPHPVWRAALALYSLYSLLVIGWNLHGASLDALLFRSGGWAAQIGAWAVLMAGAALARPGRLASVAAGIRARPERAGLVLMLAAALALRVGVAPRGLGPAGRQADEERYVQEAVRMLGTSSLDHRNYEHGAIPYWIQMAASAAYLVRSQAMGKGLALADLPIEGHVRYGRAAMALAGTLTVAALYWACLPILGRGWALGAACILAADRVHVSHGRYIHDDVPATLLVVLALGLGLRLWRGQGGLRAAAAAGLATGLAIAGKYYDFVLVVTLAIAAHRRGRQRGDPGACLAWAVGLVPIGFFLGAPGTVLHFGEFLRQLRDLHISSYAGARGATLPGFLGPSVWDGLGPILTIVLVASLVARLSAPASRDGVLLAFPVAFLILLGVFDRIYGRYLVPLHPFLALLVADALRGGTAAVAGRWPDRRTLATAGSAVLLVAGAAWPASAGLVARSRGAAPSRADLAQDWIVENLPEGACFLVEARSRVELPEGTRRVEEIDRLADLPFEEIAARGCDYAIVTAWNYRKPGRRARLEKLERELPLVAEFSAKAGPPQGIPETEARGPAIRIYALDPGPHAAPGDPPAPAASVAAP